VPEPPTVDEVNEVDRLFALLNGKPVGDFAPNTETTGPEGALVPPPDLERKSKKK